MRRALVLTAVPQEPATKRTIVFIDGQNLFHAARLAFGYTYPNYDPVALARQVCAKRGWQLDEVRFYTGIPDPARENREKMARKWDAGRF